MLVLEIISLLTTIEMMQEHVLIVLVFNIFLKEIR